MRKVFINRCSSYNDVRLMEIFENIINNTDSIKYLNSGSTVLLKTNLIIRKKPEAAATTHPTFLRALAQVLLNKGFKVVIGDSPGGLFHKTFLKSVYEVCGLIEGLKNMNVELNYKTDTAIIQNPDGIKLKEFKITKYIQDVDYIINVPKLKTHVPMILSGSIKNWFGIIAGEAKFDYHFIVSETDDFANTLIDLYMLKKPDLNIMDAVVGMDHNGPTAGNPIDIKLVLASEDGFALDLTASKIVGIDPVKIPILKAAFERNLICDNDSDIETVGESIKDVKIPNFVMPYIVQPAKAPGKVASRLFLKLIDSIKPKITFNYKECKLCKECGKVCAAKAIEFRNGKPFVNYGKCIKCFCCHELCTANAVKIKQSLVLKTILNIALHINGLQTSLENMFGMLGTGAQERDSSSADTGQT